ncbi:MAG: glycoside hydrolase family 43 protein [Luteolibacter sp.]
MHAWLRSNFLSTLGVVLLATGITVQADPIRIDDLAVHDPFILADAATHTYYLYGGYRTTDAALKDKVKNAGVKAYTSKDLVNWEGPQVVYEMGGDFWADKNASPWAPEVHAWRGKFYLFTTFHEWDHSEQPVNGDRAVKRRGSQILVADSPLGPFKPLKNRPTTPDGDFTLDGTLWIEDGKPYMVYCHEWIQPGGGTVEAVPLSEDLAEATGKPFVLFAAKDAPWARSTNSYGGKETGNAVSDGVFPFRTRSGKLLMLWSSWTKSRAYGEGVAVSESGKIHGPWKQSQEPILQDDRGHGMIFEDFDGGLVHCLHRYFKIPATRVQLWRIKDTGDSLQVGEQLFGAK